MSANTWISFDVNDVEDCRRALNQLANDIWRQHGLAITRGLLTKCVFASKQGLQRGKNFRLLRAYHDSGLSIKKFAAKIAEKNDSLGRKRAAPQWDHFRGLV